MARPFTSRSFTSYSPRVESEFKFSPITGSHIQKMLRGLSIRKATGLDGIPARLLNAASDHIHVPLAFICNMSLSLETGVFPSDWKLASEITVDSVFILVPYRNKTVYLILVCGTYVLGGVMSNTILQASSNFCLLFPVEARPCC